MLRVSVQPRILQWACERSGRGLATLREKFPKLDQWQQGDLEPTFKQLQEFARATYTPIGFFFLSEPPDERLPIPDFRTIRNERIERPSADLLDTIYLCQQRQDWYREFARTNGEEPRAFIGSFSNRRPDVVPAAGTIRAALGFELEARRRLRTWEEALRQFKQQAEALGVLIMTSGIVGSNTHRPLDPAEFRGFALADDLAPLIFINGADTKSAQMFTLAHELAHLWLGQSGLSDATARGDSDLEVERWCNRVAAELLVPLADFRREYRPHAPLEVEMKRLAGIYKVSTLVVLRRMHDAGGLSREELWRAYDAELNRLRRLRAGTSGGDFYNTTIVRTGERFATALIVSTLEGNTLFRDAYRMLGTAKRPVFDTLAAQLGVA